MDLVRHRGPGRWALRARTRPPVVQVWRLHLDAPDWDVAAAAAVLSPAEQERTTRGTADVRRRRVLLRAGLRTVLGHRLGLAPAEVPLTESDGRPHLTDPATGLEVSCSASGQLGLVALCDGAALGIDVQQHDDVEARAGLDEGWLTAGERAALHALPPARRLAAVTRCWTQKEAVLKGSGVGLRRPPVTVHTPVTPAGRTGEWALAAVPVPVGALASVAVRTTARTPRVAVADLSPAGAR